MNTKILALFFVLICLTSCERDKEITNPIIGTWHLTQRTGGLLGSQNYNPGDIIYTFDEENLVIQDNLLDKEYEYQYSIVIEEQTHSIFFSYQDINVSTNHLLFKLEIDDDIMTINSGVVRTLVDNELVPILLSDGSLISLEKEL